MNNYLKSIIVFGAVGLIFVGAGCNPFQRAQEKAQEKAAEAMAEKMLESMGGEGVDIDIDGDSANIKIKGEDGGEIVSGDNVELPDDLPKAIEVYPGATPKAVFKGLGGPGAMTITLQTDDSISKVADWYDKKYEGDFDNTQSMSLNGVEMRTYDSGDEQVIISVSGDSDGETIVTINYVQIEL